MLSWFRKLWTGKINPSSPTTVSKMSTEVRIADPDSPSSVWLPSTHHLERHRSFRRQLSRKLSSRAKQLSTCNTTACTIAVCFVVAFLALIVSCFTFYLYVQQHGLAKEIKTVEDTFNPHSASHQGAPLPPHVFDGVSTARPPRSGDKDDEGAAKIAFAHIVGSDDGTRANDRELECLTFWKVNSSHNVKFYGDYAIEIIEPGFYYVYSQIYYADSQSRHGNQRLPMLSETNRNHVPIMRSLIPFEQYSTKYHGGVFHLDKGDRITVSVSDNDLRINTGSDKTFFGVFMLSSTSGDHGPAAATR